MAPTVLTTPPATFHLDPGPKPQILVVEDESIIREITKFTLGKAGYEVDCAEDGEEGWTALCSKAYDLVITDNSMPKLSGLNLIKRIRIINPGLPIILASGSLPSPSDELQISATLQKPFASQELVALVERLVKPGDKSPIEQAVITQDCARQRILSALHEIILRKRNES